MNDTSVGAIAAATDNGPDLERTHRPHEDQPPIPLFDGTQTGGSVWLTVADSAAFLGTSERMLRKKIASGKLPSGWRVWLGTSPLRMICDDVRTLSPIDSMKRPDPEHTQTPPGPDGVRTAPDPRPDQVPRETDQHETIVTVPLIELLQLRSELDKVRSLLVEVRTQRDDYRVRLDRADEEKADLRSMIPKALPPAPRTFWWPWGRTRRPD